MASRNEITLQDDGRLPPIAVSFAGRLQPEGIGIGRGGVKGEPTASASGPLSGPSWCEQRLRMELFAANVDRSRLSSHVAALVSERLRRQMSHEKEKKTEQQLAVKSAECCALRLKLDGLQKCHTTTVDQADEKVFLVLHTFSTGVVDCPDYGSRR